MGKSKEKTVKCEGRFNQLRDFLYNIALPVVVADRTIVTDNDLKEVWDLSQDEVVTAGFDYRDPYYYCKKTDCLREIPYVDYLSLTPLVEHQLHLEEGLISKYTRAMGNNEKVSGKLEIMAQHPSRFLEGVLGREPRQIILPLEKHNTTTLTGYRVSGNFGIGTICSGGVSGGGIRSDSPFLLEIYGESQEHRGESDLAAVVGFWAQNNEMLVSQMQPCRNANLPEGVPFGIACLRVAEVSAERMGFEKVLVYSARQHPIFKEHPENWGQFGSDFVCHWDGSAKKLGYTGTRCSSYEKKVGNSINH